MLGTGAPDRHPLPRVTSIKCTDRELRSPPARAGSFLGASRPLPSAPTKVRLLTDCRRSVSEAGTTLLAPFQPLPDRETNR